MSYATITDVFKRYPLIANIVGAGTNQIASVDVSSIYIQDGESIVNAYMTRRYIIPLVPEVILTWITSDIAIYRMFEDRLPRFPDDVLRRYTNAMSMLMQLQAGKMDLLASSAQVQSGGDQDAWSSANSWAGPIFVPAEKITNTQSIMDPLFIPDYAANTFFH